MAGLYSRGRPALFENAGGVRVTENVSGAMLVRVQRSVTRPLTEQRN